MQLTEAQQQDPLAMTIVSVVSAMYTDFRSQFEKQFGRLDDDNNDDLRQLKRRLYKLLRGLSPAAIVDGYENLVSSSPKFMPGPPEIVESAKRRQQELNRRQEELENTARVAALPPPSRTAAPGEIAGMLATALQSSKKDDKAEWLKRKSEALKNHDALIKQHYLSGKTRRPMIHEDSRCALGGCNRPGTMSHSTGGADQWYCREHFRA